MYFICLDVLRQSGEEHLSPAIIRTAPSIPKLPKLVAAMAAKVTRPPGEDPKVRRDLSGVREAMASQDNIPKKIEQG